jgi:predicted RNA-binding Zn-ribbon protein involved in translation (DUF1610 family)
MPPLSASDVLRLWEAGAPLTPAGRALAILIAASPGMPPPALAALPVGRRDRRLLEIRRETFGPGLDALVPCPACGERIEFRLEAGTLLGGHDPGAVQSDAELTAGEWRVRYRMPTAGDLAEVASCEGPDRALALLVERCVVEATRAGVPAAPADLPAPALALMDQELARRDALAEILLDFVCPECGAAGQAPFDIARYLWEELRAEAARLLREVHALARVYGWREADILALSAVRRQAYLELAAS